jgi:hypothetical protein
LQRTAQKGNSVSRKKEVKEEEKGSSNSSTDSVEIVFREFSLACSGIFV